MTIKDVALAAGIPYATTWRAIHRRGKVSQRVADAVQSAVAKTGYRASPQPRANRKAAGTSTVSKASRKIALLDFRNATALSISVLRSVQQILGSQGMNLLYAHVVGPAELPTAVQAGEVDGILGYGELPDALLSPEIKKIPAVWMMTRADGCLDPWGDRVVPDNRRIGELAGKYLVSKGHRHVALLNPGGDVLLIRQRFRGLQSTVRAKGCTAQLIGATAEVAKDAELASEQVVQQWSALQPRPSGLFIPSDRLTEAVYRQLAKKNIQPGKDVEIISCDNDPEYLTRMQPPPPSIELNRQTIACLAAERLMWRMSEGMKEPQVVISVRPALLGFFD